MDARVRPARSRDRAIWTRHLANFGPLLVISASAGALAAGRVDAAMPFALRGVYALVLALNVLVLAMSSWSTVLGAALLLLQRCGVVPDCGPTLAAPTGRARTAVLFAIHEEEPARVFAAARAIADDVGAVRLGMLDVFILSDSRSAGAIAAEEATLALAARAGDGGPRLFYRKRVDNVGRKAGNIADFVRRWGAAYDFILVLDADSLMTGACIARLVGAMEANPRAGLIQAMCYPVGRTSLFAKLQQFDAQLVGPLFQKGVAFWQGPRGNFWGHNAIVRIASFAACCGLPTLPGTPPLGGEILSHDTVEAALMLRGGHDVWMLPHGPDGGPDGSWEETPTNLLDHLERDRRWLRGNLQHVRVLAARGLEVASLYHLGRGLAHFLYAPLLVVWLVLYAVLDGRAAIDPLTALVFALLAAPRLLGLAAAANGGAQRAGFDGPARLAASAGLDQALVSLSFPTLLVSHLVGLAGLLVGGETRWDAQSRDERGIGWGEAARRLGPAIGLALVAVLAIAPFAPLPAAMLAVGLCASVPLAVATSRRTVTRLFDTPEDIAPHPLRILRSRIEARLRSGERLDSHAMVSALPRDHGLAMPVQSLRR